LANFAVVGGGFTAYNRKWIAAIGMDPNRFITSCKMKLNNFNQGENKSTNNFRFTFFNKLYEK